MSVSVNMVCIRLGVVAHCYTDLVLIRFGSAYSPTMHATYEAWGDILNHVVCAVGAEISIPGAFHTMYSYCI